MFGEKSVPHRILAGLILIVTAPLLFVGVPVRIAFSEWFVEWEYNRADFPPDTYGLEDDYRKRLALLGLRAVLSEEGMEEFRKAVLPDGRRAFREKEIRHMEDVKKVLDVFFPLLYALLFLHLFLHLLMRDRIFTGWVLLLSSLFSLSLVAGAGAFALIDYDLAFEVFHNLFFEPDSWRFRYTDTLLRIYPMKFWFDGTVFVIGTASLLCAASLVAGLILIYRRSSSDRILSGRDRR